MKKILFILSLLLPLVLIKSQELSDYEKYILEKERYSNKEIVYIVDTVYIEKDCDCSKYNISINHYDDWNYSHRVYFDYYPRDYVYYNYRYYNYYPRYNRYYHPRPTRYYTKPKVVYKQPTRVVTRSNHSPYVRILKDDNRRTTNTYTRSTSSRNTTYTRPSNSRNTNTTVRRSSQTTTTGRSYTRPSTTRSSTTRTSTRIR
jgi:hypothetical protein